MYQTKPCNDYCSITNCSILNRDECPIRKLWLKDEKAGVVLDKYRCNVSNLNLN